MAESSVNTTSAAHMDQTERNSYPTFYQHLQDRHFRLLTLMPCKPGLPTVECTISAFPLGNDLKYTALSYTWGDTTRTEKILINGVEHLISHNLFDALRLLQSEMPNSFLWVDALCINQDNQSERQVQVGMMRDIFLGAQKVIAWLGQGTSSNSIATQFMKKVVAQIESNEYDDIESFLTDDKLEYWREVGYFYANPYWLRVWVIQELVCGKDIQIYWGTESISWREAAVFTAQITVEHKDALNRFLNDFCGVTDNGRPITGIPIYWMTSGSKQLHCIELCKSRHKEMHLDLEDLIYSSSLCGATEARDRIYALLGLTSKRTRAKFPVNYKRSIAELFISVTSHILIKKQNLSALPRWLSTSRGSLSDELPSWTPDYTTISKYSDLDYKELHSPYTAGGSRKMRKSGILRISENILYTTGFEVDTVATPGKPPTVRPDDYYEFSHAVTPHFWTRAVADAVAGVDKWSPKVPKLISQQRRSPEEEHLVTSELHEKVHGLIRDYLFFLKSGLWGWSPADGIRAGDKICVFIRSAVPYVMRKQEDGTYRVIGECYLDGIMYGEVIDDEKDGIYQRKEFRIK